jgi:hypothetical protein
MALKQMANGFAFTNAEQPICLPKNFIRPVLVFVLLVALPRERSTATWERIEPRKHVRIARGRGTFRYLLIFLRVIVPAKNWAGRLGFASSARCAVEKVAPSALPRLKRPIKTPNVGPNALSIHRVS